MENITSPWRVAVGIVSCGFLLFLILPSLIAIPISFGDANQIVFPPKSFSFALFQRLFTEAGWRAAAWLSLRVAVWSTCLSLCLGIPAAFAISRGSFPGKRLLSLFLLSPIMVPHVSVALALYLYFIKVGIRHGEVRLALGHVILTLPFVIVTALAGLRAIDPTLERSATIMGANQFTVLRRVTLPLLKPAVIGGGLFSFLISFDEVVISFFIRRAEYTTLPVKMFASIQWEVSPVLAAISTMLTVLSVVICLAVATIQTKEGTQ